MRMVYPLMIQALPHNQRAKIARVISTAFSKPFSAERLLEFEKAVVCQHDAEYIGVACVRAQGEYKFPTVECVSVASRFRERGVGKETVECVQADLGYDQLTLHVDRIDNPNIDAALSLYQSCDFKIVRSNEKEHELEWMKHKV